jgi:hypothetical protein
MFSKPVQLVAREGAVKIQVIEHLAASSGLDVSDCTRCTDVVLLYYCYFRYAALYYKGRLWRDDKRWLRDKSNFLNVFWEKNQVV